MKPTPNRRQALGLIALLLPLGVPLAAQNFDSSGTGVLKGDYFVRQVLLDQLDQNTSAAGRAVSLTGVMTFDGNGNYSFTGQLFDSKVGSAAAYSVSGQYAVQPNGLAQIQNPIDTREFEVGAVGAIGPAGIVASDTESLVYDDVFVAIPAASGASNGSIQGSYQAGFIDFLEGNPSLVRDGYFALSSSGNGSFGNLVVNGAMANQGSTNTTQNLNGVTYSIGSNGGGSLTFPVASDPHSALLSGQKTFYVSKDGNLLLGGSANGFDLIVCIRAASGVTNDTYKGTYFTAALENDAFDLANGNNSVDSFSGSTLALGEGTTISHFRQVFFDQNAADYTYDGTYNLDVNGLSQLDLFEDLVGAGGQASLQVGRSDFYTLNIRLHAMDYTGTGVFLNPLQVFNAASFAPITNSLAPGEYVSLFGSGLSSVTLLAQSFPLSTNLGGVQVMANGVAAPLGYVSSTQINLVIPFELDPNTDPYITFQVINNGVASNKVTLYNNFTSPGVFSLNNNGGTFPSGVGPAAVRHADFSLVTPDNPARPGDTLLLYVGGMGSVTPSIANGAPAPTDSLVNVDAGVNIEIQDQDNNIHTATVPFAGLAPGFAGLYQINFVVPNDVPSGLQWVNIGTPDAYTSEAKLYVQSSVATKVRGAAVSHQRRLPARQRRHSR